VSIEGLPLESPLPVAGESGVFGIRLEGDQTVRGVLGHL
jgi:hypothetical protein